MRKISSFAVFLVLIASLGGGAIAKPKPARREVARPVPARTATREHKILFSNEADAKRACDEKGVTTAPAGRFTCAGGINRNAGIEQ